MIAFYSLTCTDTNLLFCCASILISFARLAYLSVLRVSSNWLLAGEVVQIITVLLLPSSESFKSLVNLLSLYGMNMPFLLPSPSALMQLARANKERFILAPSLSRIPLFSVAVPLSEPARSIKDNFDSRKLDFVPFFLS